MNHNIIIIKSGKYEANLMITQNEIELFYWNNYSILSYDKKTGKVKVKIKGNDDQKLLDTLLSDYLEPTIAKTIKNKLKKGNKNG
jgi:hypothetical protein